MTHCHLLVQPATHTRRCDRWDRHRYISNYLNCVNINNAVHRLSFGSVPNITASWSAKMRIRLRSPGAPPTRRKLRDLDCCVGGLPQHLVHDRVETELP